MCVELRIHHLLLNAVLQAPQLAEVEGTVLEQSRGGRTLALLRSLMSHWAADASVKCASLSLPLRICLLAVYRVGEKKFYCDRFDESAWCRSLPVADSLVRRLHAWLASPAAALHSPQLLAVVNTAMTKTFLQLLAEIKALDAVIVSASHTSLVLATRKHSTHAAAAYVSFLVDTLASRELFRWIALKPHCTWLTLLWRDRFNFAGIAAPGGVAALQGDAGSIEAEDEQESGPKYDAQWSLRDFLSPAMHKYFDDVVQRFVTRPWQAVTEAAQADTVRIVLLGPPLESAAFP